MVNMKLIWGNEYQPRNSDPLYLHFKIKKIIYEDKHHLFFRPEMIACKEDIL